MVLRYIQGMKYYGHLYKKNKKCVLVGYSDAYFFGSVDDRASTSGYLMNMGSTVISWSCKKKTTIANSSAEEEYISAWEETCEIAWSRMVLQDLGISQT